MFYIYTYWILFKKRKNWSSFDSARFGKFHEWLGTFFSGDDKDAKAETKEDPNAKDDPNAGKAQGKQGAIGGTLGPLVHWYSLWTFWLGAITNPEEQRPCCTMWA